MLTTLLCYRWRYFDPVRMKICTTRYHATADEIRHEHPDAVAVTGSEQAHKLADDPLVNSMARFQSGVVGE